MWTGKQKIHRFHSPAMFLNVNTFWQSLDVFDYDLCWNETHPVSYTSCHALYVYYYDCYYYCFASFSTFFCFFFSIRVVYACDFQFALFTLVHFLFVHTYRKAFTNINNNNTFELIFVLSRLGFRFVSILVFSLTTHLKLWNEFEFCFQ